MLLDMLETFAVGVMKADGGSSAGSSVSSTGHGTGSGGGDFLNSVRDLFESIGANFDMTTLFVGLGVTLVISVVVFAAIVERRKAPRLGFFRWLREYLNFRTMLIAGLLKFLHLFLATAITVTGVIVMFQGGNDVGTAILVGLAIILVGNIILRLISELFMLIISLWQNITDIRAVIVKDEEAPEEKAPKAPKEKKEKHHEEKTEKQETSAEVPTETAPVEVSAEVAEVEVAQVETPTVIPVETSVAEVAEAPVEAPVSAPAEALAPASVPAEEAPAPESASAPVEASNEAPTEVPVRIGPTPEAPATE